MKFSQEPKRDIFLYLNFVTFFLNNRLHLQYETCNAFYFISYWLLKIKETSKMIWLSFHLEFLLVSLKLSRIFFLLSDASKNLSNQTKEIFSISFVFLKSRINWKQSTKPIIEDLQLCLMYPDIKWGHNLVALHAESPGFNSQWLQIFSFLTDRLLWPVDQRVNSDTENVRSGGIRWSFLSKFEILFPLGWFECHCRL